MSCDEPIPILNRSPHKNPHSLEAQSAASQRAIPLPWCWCLRFQDSLGCRHERIDLCRHNKVVPVQASYRVRPESHRSLTPFGQNSRMMAFRFRESSNAIREAQGLRKIAETKCAFQSLDGLPFHQPPVRDLKLQFLNFLCGYSRRILPACGTSFVSEYAHNAFTSRQSR